MVRHGGKNDRFWRKKRRSSTVDFTKANLTNADLSGSLLTAVSRTGDTTIDFSEANLINADLSGAGLTSASGKRELPEDAVAKAPSNSLKPTSPTPTSVARRRRWRGWRGRPWRRPWQVLIGDLIVVCVTEAESMATAYPAARNLCAAVTLYTSSSIVLFHLSTLNRHQEEYSVV